MRGAAANACMRMGATVVDVCKMARWQMAAWVRARGYDYTRQRLGDTAGVATAMMLNILAATPTEARLTESRREQQMDHTVALVAFGAAVGLVVVGAIIYWPDWAPSIFATHPDSTPDGDKVYKPDYPPTHPPRSADDEPEALFRAEYEEKVGTKCTTCVHKCEGVLQDPYRPLTYRQIGRRLMEREAKSKQCFWKYQERWEPHP